MPLVNFQASWKNYFPWVKESKCKLTAECTWCNTSFSYSTMGRAALSSHAKGKKHQTIVNNKEKSIAIKDFLQIAKPSSTPPLLVESQASTSSQDINNFIPTTFNNSKQANPTLDKYKLRDDVTEAEILWCVSTVINHNSLRNAESSVLLFSKMFKECSVAKEMKLHKDKISYSIVYGIAPYFKDLLKTTLMEGTHYVIGFDESFNKIAQRTQMDLHIRFWDVNSNTVKFRYLDSVFLNQTKATDLLAAFKTGIDGLDFSKILQISMDGPNVNWAFLKLIKEDFNASLGPDGPQLLELGSCGLHIVHGAFKTGIKKTEWNIIQFLRALYNLFKMVPARRGHFTEITSSSLFPLQFCTVRWVENSRVAQRAIEILPSLKIYINSINGTEKEPTSNSYTVVKTALKDKLLLAKLAFFQSLAEQLEPFLKEFQSDAPMVPFLHESLVNLLKGIMNRFVKKEEMEKEDFFKINVFEKENTLYKFLMKIKDVDLGYGTRSALKKCKEIKDKDVLIFRKEARTCYQYLVAKIQEKSPLKYPLTKATSFLNPISVSFDEKEAYSNMEKALDIMVQSNIITAAVAEKADMEYREIVCQPHFKLKSEKYSRKEERVDHFWMSEVYKKETLTEVVKKFLILSHGNSSLERGFSVNKDILTENMREDYLVAQRIVYDAVSDAGGLEEWSNNTISRKLIQSMRNAYNRFKEVQEQQRKIMSEKDKRATEKRKLVFLQKELEEKRRKTIEKMKEELFSIDEKIKTLQSSSEY